MFETYAHLNRHQNCIWMAPFGAKIGWFKGPDGNLPSLTGPPGASSEPSVR